MDLLQTFVAVVGLCIVKVLLQALLSALACKHHASFAVQCYDCMRASIVY